ncbi:hypothetical protein NDU88_004497 [Pleurodeles waltl]|uniref:Uncharacterized protein n=1 Tax=Pleurodeles waltl TaxID=8319 RepID=A0AAV7T7Y3_PLEWA|nr:hypothetical protein NDU88_004497 [Pleurodeles waltl]
MTTRPGLYPRERSGITDEDAERSLHAGRLDRISHMTPLAQARFPNQQRAQCSKTNWTSTDCYWKRAKAEERHNKLANQMRESKKGRHSLLGKNWLPYSSLYFLGRCLRFYSKTKTIK